MRLTAQRGPTRGFSSSTRLGNKKRPHIIRVGPFLISVACEGFET
jgi:hypothetical protein